MKKVVLILMVFLGGAVYAQFDSLNVRFVGNWPFGPSYAVAHDSARSLVFLGSGGGVYTLDASDPTNPVKLSEGIRTRGVVEGLFYEAASRRLYIADGKAGLEIWDVSIPTSPVKLGGYYAPSLTQDVFVSDPYAYITGDHKLRVIDVSTPSAPQEVGQCDLLELNFENVYVSGSYAYVRCESREGNFGHLSIIDVSTPSHPQEVGHWTIPFGSSYYDSGRIYVSGSYAYIPCRVFLYVLDVSIPSNPQWVGICELSDPDAWGLHADNIYVSGTHAYITLGGIIFGTHGALCVVDVSDPTAPQKVGWCGGTHFPYDLSVSGSHVYIACNYGLAGSFSIIDVSTPSNPQRTGYYETLNWANDVYVSNSYAYLADCSRGVKVIDVSTPSNPQVVGSCKPLASSQGIYVSGSYAYVSDLSGFQVIDVSKPSDPHEVGRCGTPGYANDVYVAGSYAYVAAGNKWDYESKGGLHIIDICVRSNPREISYFEIQSPATGVYVTGAYAYVAAGDAGLRVICVCPRSNPKELGYWDDYARDVYLSGSHAYVAGNNKLHVIDVSIPSEPQEVNHCDLDLPEGSKLNNVFVSGSYAYVACSEAVRVIDISTPSNPHEVGYYETPASAYAVYTSDRYIYVADGAAGLQIYELLPIGVKENPMTIASPICLTPTLNRLAYDVPGQAQLTLYSADGRRVLEETVEGKGTWDAPAAIPHGVYFARIENDSGSIRAKLVVLR